MMSRSDELLLRQLANIVMSIPSRRMLLEGNGLPGDRDSYLLMEIDAFKFDKRVQRLSTEDEAFRSLSSKERDLLTGDDGGLIDNAYERALDFYIETRDPKEVRDERIS